jgi:hypothetical protein
MIPLPRPWLMTGAMLVGTAVGIVASVGAMLLVSAPLRPDIVIALVLGVPGGAGLLLVLFSSRRWITTLGAFVLALGPGWFGALAAIEAVNGG